MSFTLVLICLAALALVAWTQWRQEKKIAEIITANNAMDDDLTKAEAIITRLDAEIKAYQVIPDPAAEKAATAPVEYEREAA
ncbi:hypothetical protein H7347_06935 [Corynebacterium sp. zg-331]|uniref:hypothetical protein n=1 Tax=unclassified Corynebacterium TaxID=2624378 RepID=UPI00128B9CD6|nr:MULTISPECIES: hypothetical protein [unclassified Corynebacterium]MBC3186307.1 hypothetical protein [Corynebacterium sp. zg-331]MPV52795.1 hypothetical protein [Corynebacterium sp. zg331]